MWGDLRGAQDNLKGDAASADTTDIVARAPTRSVLAGVALVLTACAHQEPAAPPPPSSPSPVLNQAVPAFRRPTMQGPTFDTAEVGTRVMVVDFFAAYCRPCQKALPALEALHRERPDVTIVGVSLDDAPEAAARMINRHRLTFPVIHDRGHVLAGRFRVTELPTAFVVDGSGRIIWMAGPAQPEDALPRAVSAWAKGRSE
jgi:peroxiredoxin